MHPIYSYATALGAAITYTDLSHLGRDGDTDVDRRHIRLQDGMTCRLEVCTLAHEVAHLLRGDRTTMFGYFDERDERRADEWAARYLVDIDEYRHAEAMCGTNTKALANELDVVLWVVEAFERQLCRIGDHVYLNPKYGAGNFEFRFEAVA